ncbi:MAG: FAD-dependent oxidoreductase [Planctomycetota bacterium]|nr:MAG: FAD-dependent oxidoreductase [Planctomycetota bacterium]
MLETDVLIIGGGPAGMCAAIEAAKLGVKTTVVEDKDRLGGQLVKQTHQFFGSEKHHAGVRGIDIGVKLAGECSDLKVNALTNTTCTGIFDDGSVGCLRGEEFFLIHPKRIVIATGAYENMLPFPDCDLPGVYGAGGLQTLMNVDGVLPGKTYLMVGAGNIGLIVSYQLMQAGAEVVAIVEALDRVGGYEVHAAKVKRMGVPIFLRHTVTHVSGDGKVERATISKIDGSFKPVPGSEFTVSVDAVCLAVGLSPLIELIAQAGCETRYIPECAGHVAVHDSNMRTSLEHIFVAGDASGIEEASAAMVEGRIAGLHAALDVTHGKADSNELLREFDSQLDELRTGPFGQKARQGKSKLWGLKLPPDEEFEEAPPIIPESGKKPVIECPQNIPCNPCAVSCPTESITIGDNITNFPVLDQGTCNGCGNCVAACPGLAVFLVNRDYSDREAEITIPWELTPPPEKGDKGYALDRTGVAICPATVTKIRRVKKIDKKRLLVAFTVPLDKADEARHFVIVEPKGAEKIETLPPADDIIICRCEDVTQKEILDCFNSGYKSFDEIKRYLRTGMGPCQGKTCQRLILGILARELKTHVSELAPQTVRTPMKPTELEIYASSKEIEPWDFENWQPPGGGH